MDDVRLSGNTIYLSTSTNYRWDMVFPMILDIEQIKVCLND